MVLLAAIISSDALYKAAAESFANSRLVKLTQMLYGKMWGESGIAIHKPTNAENKPGWIQWDTSCLFGTATKNAMGAIYTKCSVAWLYNSSLTTVHGEEFPRVTTRRRESVFGYAETGY